MQPKQEWYVEQIRKDMDICDVNGEKVGTVARVYHRAPVPAGSVGESSFSSPHEGYVEVKTGFLGLGKHYFVPTSAIQDVTEGGVFLSVSRHEIDGQGWYHKPANLDEMR